MLGAGDGAGKGDPSYPVKGPVHLFITSWGVSTHPTQNCPLCCELIAVFTASPIPTLCISYSVRT